MSVLSVLGVIEKAKIGLLYYNDDLELEERHTLEVPFNPSRLQYFASSEKIIQSSYRQQNLKDMRFQQEAKAITGQLSFQLIFDEVERTDAFMMDIYDLSIPNPTDAIKAAATLINTAISGNPSVRDTMCAMMSALMTEVDAISFRWGEIDFTGTMTEVQMEFNMFSVCGEPVRGVIDMRLTERVDVTQKSESNNKAFESLFKDNIADATSVSQKIGNLLNLNI